MERPTTQDKAKLTCQDKAKLSCQDKAKLSCVWLKDSNNRLYAKWV